MTWIARLKSFKFYCEKQGYELLPDDYRFIHQGLFLVPKNDNRRVLGRYLEEWRLGMGETQKTPHRDQGAGRRAANNWFREYIEKLKDRSDCKERDAID